MSDCCPRPPTYEFALELRAVSQHELLPTTPIILACGEHAEAVWADIGSLAGWGRICSAMDRAGHTRPIREVSSFRVRLL